MKLKTLKNLFADGVKYTWRNKLMCLASVSSVTASLIVLGIFIIISIYIDGASKLIEKNQVIKVFFQKLDTPSEIEDYKQKILATGYATNVTYESKEQSRENFNKQFGEKMNVRFGNEATLFNSAFDITLKNPESLPFLTAYLSKLPGIGTISSKPELMKKLSQILKIIRWISFCALVLLFTTAVFIISNTIKLTVFARRKEIGIMKYIGATDSFIRIPFIIESIVIGTLASLLSISIVYFGYNKIYEFISSFLGMITNFSIDSSFWSLFALYIGIGIGIACLGSIISLRKYLKV